MVLPNTPIISLPCAFSKFDHISGHSLFKLSITLPIYLNDANYSNVYPSTKNTFSPSLMIKFNTIRSFLLSILNHHFSVRGWVVCNHIQEICMPQLSHHGWVSDHSPRVVSHKIHCRFPKWSLIQAKLVSLPGYPSMVHAKYRRFLDNDTT